MNPDQAADLATRIVQTWPRAIAAHVWEEELLDLDQGRAGTALVKLRRSMKSAPSIAEYLDKYRELYNEDGGTRPVGLRALRQPGHDRRDDHDLHRRRSGRGVGSGVAVFVRVGHREGRGARCGREDEPARTRPAVPRPEPAEGRLTARSGGDVLMTTTSRDLRYGRRGGGWADTPQRPRVTGRPCDVCSQPMVVGQRSRHFMCSPPAPCCGHPIDLIPDMAKHRADHSSAPENSPRTP
jgi:hypothetical protein